MIKKFKDMKMKYKIGSVLIGFVLIIAFAAYKIQDDSSKNKVILEAVTQSLKVNHFESKKYNDSFSEKAYELYLERLDYNKRFLIKPDIDKLSLYRERIDDEIKNSSYSFFDLSYSLIEKGIAEAEKFYPGILDEPFDFKRNETIELDPEKIDFAADYDELNNRWRKYLKYRTLKRLYSLQEQQEKKKEKNDTTFEEKSYEQLEKEAREKVLKDQEDWFHRLSKLEKADRRSLYLNAITNTYDPHTGYYPPKDKEDFDIRMSGQLEGIGATLTQQADGYIKVVRIVVGSASWRQGDLEVGDLILKVAQKDEEPVDVVDMRLDKAVQLIRGPKGTEVTLTVKKRDGIYQDITIERDVVILDETFAKSLILQDNNDENKTGYIYLPKFYLDLKGNKGRSCAEDVEKEIEKLKKENVNGIILDLRNNGGGSLQDVVKIAGMFIEKGPIVQVKSRYGEPYVLKDKNPAIQFTKPLVVMVNAFSASASEIFSAAIQDYHRGIIVGSNSTYGKGTVQRFINFDDIVPKKFNQYKPLGSIKMTIQKFYRIDGGTTQLKGVIPDILLPDEYSYIEIGEKEQENAMAWDEIEPVEYEEWYKPYPVDKIQKKSQARVKKNQVFGLIDEHAKWLKEQRDRSVRSLNLAIYREEKHDTEKEAKQYENIQSDETGLEIATLAADEEYIARDSITIEKRAKWIKKLKKDAYLYEAFSVLDDIDE
jgi:carboxyl-terminal processing protease